MIIEEATNIFNAFKEKHPRGTELLYRIFHIDRYEIINFLYSNLWNRWWSYRYLAKKLEKIIEKSLKRDISLMEVMHPKHSSRYCQKLMELYPDHVKKLLDRPL